MRVVSKEINSELSIVSKNFWHDWTPNYNLSECYISDGIMWCILDDLSTPIKIVFDDYQKKSV